MLSSQEKQLILLNMCYHNEGLRRYLSRDYKKFENLGLTKSLHDDKREIDIILRLMDNRNFDKADDNTKKEMVYSDYYPLESRTDKKIYMDDRRNLCQALHNKLCAGFQIPQTLVKLVGFRETEMDEDLFQFYNYQTGEIFINTDLDFAECGETELAQAVLRGTFIYQLHNELKNNFNKIDELSGRQKYLLLSLLMKTYILESFDKAGKKKERDAIQYNDGYSSAYVYATFSTYEYLNKLFEKYKLMNYPQLEDFKECRLTYLESLTNSGENESGDDEEFDDITSTYDRDADEVSAEADIEDEGCILDDTIDNDIDLLYEMVTSEISKITDGELFEIFKRELNESYQDFYDFFGYQTEFGFADEFENYKETCDALKEAEEQEDE